MQVSSSQMLSSNLLALGDKSFWLPGQHSTVAGSVDGLFMFITWFSAFFMVLIFGILIYFVIVYRNRPGHKETKTISHYLPLELVWSVPPSFFLVVMFFWGMKGYMDIATVPDDAYVVNVTAQKWSWLFHYPETGAMTNELHVPVNTDVRLVMRSEDVIHSLYIPAFRVKKDVVPGRYHSMWFNATDVGTYHLFCTEYCGTSHYAMITKCVVHEPDDFRKWLAKASDIFMTEDADGNPIERPLSEVGKILVEGRGGCLQCHSMDGSKNTGPTFQGIFGRNEKMTDGSSVTVDENYIRESILYPTRQVVEGYDNVMPTFQGKFSDREVDAVIEYLKTIK